MGALDDCSAILGDSNSAKPIFENSEEDASRHSNSRVPATPFDILSAALPLPAPCSSTQYWWQKTGPLLSALLFKANYPLYSHYRQLLLYHTYLVPLLGPRPPPQNEEHPSTSNAPWRSFLTDDFSPLEPSWNVHGNQSTVRLGIEPVGSSAGTALDPFNQRTPTDFMPAFATSELSVDLMLFEHFKSHLHIFSDSGSAAATALQSKVPDGEHMSQNFIAFDFDKNRVSTKVYFFPILKALETGQSTTRVVADSILSLAYKSSWGVQMIASMSVLEAWLASCHDKAKVEIISVDCVDEAKSRIKVYVRIPDTSLRRVKDAYSLGGRLRDEFTREGLKVLDELWRLLFQLPTQASEDVELPSNGHRTAGVIFNFELQPGQWFPEPKIYIPVRHYCESDAIIAERLQIFYGRMGWSRLEQEYKKDVEELFPHHPLTETAGTHTYVSFSHKKNKGVYMTMYYNPRFYSV